ncbi:MAG: ATP-binding cassette domain-containing protein [Candidatus Cloacimonadaceae bacterium]|nr:ATP-binding cassette domain-containing protein [Candidatus Cloacimonadaceae bacterium]
MANVSEFTETIQQGLGTIVGPNGNRLSVGQKQRIAIARVLIRNPLLVLMDEPLSNVDSKSEGYILEK